MRCLYAMGRARIRLAREQDLARGHGDEPGDHLHSGGLAGTVRSQIAGHFAGAAPEKLTSSTAAMPEKRLQTLRSSSISGTLLAVPYVVYYSLQVAYYIGIIPAWQAR